MFIGIIASIVLILVILAYMSNSSMIVDTAAVKMAYEKIKFNYPIEKVLAASVENLCQKDPGTCKAKFSGGVISLAFSDLSPYLPTNFENNNIVGGSYNVFEIIDNNTTIRITQNIIEEKARFIFLHHYRGREFGISPKCVLGTRDSTPPCNSSDVYHDYPTSLETRGALE